jgi:hypothetical protein
MQPQPSAFDKVMELRFATQPLSRLPVPSSATITQRRDFDQAIEADSFSAGYQQSAQPIAGIALTQTQRRQKYSARYAFVLHLDRVSTVPIA